MAVLGRRFIVPNNHTDQEFYFGLDVCCARDIAAVADDQGSVCVALFGVNNPKRNGVDWREQISLTPSRRHRR
ncbi:MAG: hypothetical protein BGO50_06775 [Rhodanobacter sp. 67-28]|nr:MAG: hypothetical protein BGO50_06775 [Rhodanobacter sp. 67-28]